MDELEAQRYIASGTVAGPTVTPLQRRQVMAATPDLEKPYGAGTMLGHIVTVVFGAGLMLLGLPAGIGIVDGLTAWHAAWSGGIDLPPAFNWDDVWISALINSFCVATGAFLVFWGLSLATREYAETRNRREHPVAPWRWRMEWGDHVIRARARSPMLAYVLTAWLSVVTLPAGVATVLSPSHAGEASWWGMAVLLGALLVSAFFTWRLHRDRVAARSRGFALVLNPWPLPRGVATQLNLQSEMAAGALEHITTRLLCEEVQERHTSTRGSRSKNKSVRRNVLWDTTGRHALLHAGQTLSWPVRLPAKLPASTANHDAAVRIEWRLEVSWAGLRTPLVFDIPVFADAGQSGFSSSALAAEPKEQEASGGVLPIGWVVMMDPDTGFEEDVFEAAPLTDLTTEEIAEGLAAQGIRSEWEGDRLRLLHLPARRHRRMLYLLGAVNVAWTALVAVMVVGGAPWFFSLGFGLFNALFWGIFFKVLTSDQVISFDVDGVRIAKGRKADLSLVKPVWLRSLNVELSMRTGNRHFYNIAGSRSDGTSGTLIGDVEGVHLCHAVTDRVLAVGRKRPKPRKQKDAATD